MKIAGIEQNDGVKKERSKLSDREGSDNTPGKYNLTNTWPLNNQPLDKGPRNIYTNTNEITNPQVTSVSMYALPLGYVFQNRNYIFSN